MTFWNPDGEIGSDIICACEYVQGSACLHALSEPAGFSPTDPNTCGQVNWRLSNAGRFEYDCLCVICLWWAVQGFWGPLSNIICSVLLLPVGMNSMIGLRMNKWMCAWTWFSQSHEHLSQVLCPHLFWFAQLCKSNIHISTLIRGKKSHTSALLCFVIDIHDLLFPHMESVLTDSSIDFFTRRHSRSSWRPP